MNISQLTRYSYLSLLFVVIHAYVILALVNDWQRGLFCLTILGKVYSFLFLKKITHWIWPIVKDKTETALERVGTWGRVRICGIPIYRILPCILLLIFFCWIASGALGSIVRLRAIGGLAIYILLAVAISTSPRKIRWRPVIGGFALQSLFGTIFLKWPAGNRGLQWTVNKVVSFLDLTFIGTEFVYGFIGNTPPICGFDYSLIFTALQIIIFFGAMVGILYHFGVIQAVLTRLSFFMRITLGTKGAESLNAAACIFVGQTEAALLVGPSLSSSTASQLHSIMTTGFSCIAGSLFSAFIAFGACPAYLLSATVMSACVSLSISKIVVPEDEEEEEEDDDHEQMDANFEKNSNSSLLESVCSGSIKSWRLALAIGANLLVFLALLSCINAALTYLGTLVGYNDITLNWLLSRAFYPLAYMMGSSDAQDPEEAARETMLVAELMGMKTVLNEFLAYQQLSHLVTTGQLVGARARMVATFACCGFSNISMIGSTLGTLGQLVPQRRALLAKLVVRALLSGIISCFVTATVAGILIDTPTACQPLHQTECIEIQQLQEYFNIVH